MRPRNLGIRVTALSAQSIFAAAERAFVEGRLAEARNHLLALERAQLRHPAVYHLRGLVERGLGADATARRYLEAAIQLAPNDPQILNNYGNLLGDLGDEPAALKAYERALAASPSFLDAALNRAITLYRLQLYSDARSAFHALASKHPRDVRIWNALGALEREAGEAAAASSAFDRALEASSGDPAALKGRARMALERAEPDVLVRYRSALAVAPGDPELLIEQTDARLAQGEDEAIEDFAAVVHRSPDWTAGQVELARMLWESRRDPSFAEHVKALLQRQPRRRDLWLQNAALLAASGHYEEASRAAGDARRALGDSDELKLLEAVHAGRAGDLDRAEALFGQISTNVPKRASHEAVHRIRQGKLELARKAVDRALEEDDQDISSWAVAELIYRKLDDPRSKWLSGQQGLVRTTDLALAPEQLAGITDLLDELHKRGAQIVGQSVRNGTQTRWRLFDRAEPRLQELRSAIDQALAEYFNALPPPDERHPLLRHRDAPMTIVGSWSIRLTGSGYHVSHMHPEGIVSSACYFVVPELQSSEGQLELGRPPSNLLLDLEPLQAVTPKPGRLVLFPSYLHHGTRPFSSGTRMTVAFDVNRHPAPIR